MKEVLIERLKVHEGYRPRPYRDTVGKLTIGYGRNLEDVGIDEDEAEILLSNDLDVAMREANRAFPWLLDLDDMRKGVIYEMVFNMGINRVTLFKKMITAIRERNYTIAAEEMLNSKWAKQVKGRAVTLAKIMQTGG